MSRAALTALAAAFLLPACKPAPSGGGGGESIVVTVSTFVVKSIVARRSAGHLHLMLSAQVKNTGGAALTLAPPAAQLLAGTRAVERFIAPGLEPAVIPAGGEGDAEMHWWLEAQDLSGSLTVEIGGSRAEIKTAAGFALDLLPEGRAVSLAFPDWKVR